MPDVDRTVATTPRPTEPTPSTSATDDTLAPSGTPGSTPNTSTATGACWSDGSCPELAAHAFGDGRRLVVVDGPDGSQAVLVGGATALAAVYVVSLDGAASIDCRDVDRMSFCVVQGSAGGDAVHASVLEVDGAGLTLLPPDLSSYQVGLTFLAGGSGAVVLAGVADSFGYGLDAAAAPKAWRTWRVSTDGVVSTGCGTPALTVGDPPAAEQTGPCDGTPEVAGFGPDSAHRLGLLGHGFVTPSGNLRCGAGDGTITCVIAKADFSLPRCTSGTTTGAGATLTAAGPPAKLDGCQQDPLPGGGAATAGYDTFYLDASGFGCLVTESKGVTCRNPSGAGFTLARAGYSTF